MMTREWCVQRMRELSLEVEAMDRCWAQSEDDQDARAMKLGAIGMLGECVRWLDRELGPDPLEAWGRLIAGEKGAGNAPESAQEPRGGDFGRKTDPEAAEADGAVSGDSGANREWHDSWGRR